jgi:broad specificity phosphatase PhoE
MAVVYLIRHGRTSLNAAGLLRGRLDPPLDSAGCAEAERLGDAFTDVLLKLIIASPLRRAIETAEPIARATGAELRPEPALADRDYGPWNGKSGAVLEQRFGSVDDAPGVESLQTFQQRILAAFDAAADMSNGQPVAVVAHDAVNRSLLVQLAPSSTPEPFPQPTGCWNLLCRDNGGWTAPIIGALPVDGRRPGVELARMGE